MALADLMAVSLNVDTKKLGLSEERVREQLPVIRQYVAF